jgi:sulfatase modifying factor 1
MTLRLFQLCLLSLLVTLLLLPAWAEEKVPPAITNSLGMKVVRVPAGKFIMGSPLTEQDRDVDEDQHKVEITRPFYLGAHEVTQGQFARVMGYNPAFFASGGRGKFAVTYKWKPGGGKERVKGMATSSFPIENVSWEEASAFCKKLSDLAEEKRAGRVYSLPTEAEWEYACRERGSAITTFHQGNALSSRQANFHGAHPYGGAARGPYLARTTKVGSYKPNALGLYDMHGNVWEWCADWYAPYDDEVKKDPRGPVRGTSRVLRGGSWNDFAKDCRAGNRIRVEPKGRALNFGFRVVCRPREKRK